MPFIVMELFVYPVVKVQVVLAERTKILGDLAHP